MEKLPLNLVYSFKLAPGLFPVGMEESGEIQKGRDDEHREQLSSCYQILHFFSEKEKLDRKWLSEIYQKVFSRSPWPSNYLGPFEGLGEINQFALKICSELQSPMVYLLSVSDFNMGIESLSHVQQFAAIFPNYGKKLTNPSFAKGEKSSFFKRIFRDS